MSSARIILVGVLLAGVACSESELAPLEFTAIAPSRRPVDDPGWLILKGSGFEPRLSWQDGDQGVELDEQFEVLVGQQPSPEVHRLDPEHLAFRVPAGLPAGRVALEVRAPDGRQTTGAAELCLFLPSEQITYLLPDAINQGAAGDICLSPDDPVGGSCTVISGGDRVPMHEDAYAVSPDGRWLAHLAAFQDAVGVGVSLRLRSLVDPARAPWEGARLPWVDPEPGWLADVAVPISRPVFSRDGRWVAWVEAGRRLLLLDLEAAAFRADVLAEVPASSEGALGYPDFDPRGDAIVLTAFQSPRQIWAVDAPRTLLRVAIDTGEVSPAVEREASGEQWDGPASFSPDGRHLVFLSNRYGLELLFGSDPTTPMVPAWMSFQSRLSSGEVTPVHRPSVELGLGQPGMDPSGRLLVVPGFKADTGAAELDLLVRDRKTGEFFRPEGREARDAACPVDAAFCSAYHGNAAFTADGRSLYGSRAQYATYQILGITTDVELERTVYRATLPEPGDLLPGEAEGWSLPASEVVHYRGAAFASAMAVRPYLQGDCP